MEYPNELVDAVGNSLSIGDEIVWMPGNIKGTIESFTASGKSARWTRPYEIKQADGTTITRFGRYCKPLHKLVRLPKESVGTLEEKDLLIDALTKELEEVQLKLIELEGDNSTTKEPVTSESLSKQLMELLAKD